MITVFIEYKLKAEHRFAYLAYIPQLKVQIEERGGRDFRWYEGMEQSGLFVEMLEVPTREAYEALKAWRLADQTLAAYIEGGAAKQHIWAFSPVDASRTQE